MNRSPGHHAEETFPRGDHAEGLSHAADRLLDAIDRIASPVCVGLDPVVERLPARLRPRDAEPRAAVSSILSFCLGVLDSVCAHVPCVKVQSACFERFRAAGVEAMFRIMSEARARGVQVILDAKRGDIGVSAEHYAAAVFGASPHEPDGDRADWVTVNSYLGADGIEPFMREGCGALALVRTSNPGGDALQSARLANGKSVAEEVASMVAKLGASRLGKRGFSALGAVVGATRPAEAARLRELMPQQIFLVPGYGAQGAGAEDILPCFTSAGQGAVVTASRSVLYAFDPDVNEWAVQISDAAKRFADEVRSAIRRRSA